MTTSQVVSEVLAGLAGLALLVQALLDQRKEQAVQVWRLLVPVLVLVLGFLSVYSFPFCVVCFEFPLACVSFTTLYIVHCDISRIYTKYYTSIYMHIPGISLSYQVDSRPIFITITGDHMINIISNHNLKWTQKNTIPLYVYTRYLILMYLRLPCNSLVPTAELSSIREPGMALRRKTKEKHEHAHTHTYAHVLTHASQMRREAIASASAAQATGKGEAEEKASAAGEGQVLLYAKKYTSEPTN